MKIKSKIRQSVSQVYDVLIPENKWEQYAEMLDRDGHPNRRELCKLILVFGQHIETLEDMIEDLYFQIELLEGNKEATAPQKAEFKLRTPIDVFNDLQGLLKPDSKCFYLSADDWAVLEKTVKPNDPENGYGKERNEKTGNEETCLYYKSLPVFKK